MGQAQMGKSFVTLDNKIILAKDLMLQTWYHFLARAINESNQRDAWIDGLRNELTFLSHGGSGAGIVSLFLDEYVKTAEHLTILISLCEAALDLITRFGSHISVDYLNSIPYHDEWQWPRDISTEPVECCGRHFIRLLRGEITTEVGDGGGYVDCPSIWS